MHDLFIALIFAAMVIGPAILAFLSQTEREALSRYVAEDSADTSPAPPEGSGIASRQK